MNTENQKVMNEEILKKYSNQEACPVRNVVDRIGDKWSLLVILVLEDGGVMRFKEICDTIGTISQKMLTVTLRGLEADGLLERTVYPQIPPKVEYALTERGKSLLPHLHSLVKWAQNNMGDIRKSRETYEVATSRA